MLKNIYFSAGEYCAAAHQIRRHTQNNESYFFDWLVTRNSSFEFIGQKSELFLQPMNWEITDNGIRLLDRYSGLLFQHEFKTLDCGGGIDPTLVEGHLEMAREKFMYLKEKLIAALNSSRRCVIVRAENGIQSIEQAKARLNAFLPINADLRFVVASTQLYQGEEFSAEHCLIRLDKPTQPDGKDSWKGNDHSWDRLFDLAERNLVFRK